MLVGFRALSIFRGVKLLEMLLGLGALRVSEGRDNMGAFKNNKNRVLGPIIL